jgi:L-seryl-tRNA(Ser) seleniumtransferase
MAGLDAARMGRLPQADGFPNEFVIAREQRSGYDHAVRAAGARLVEVGFNEPVAGAGVRRTEAWEYEAAFGERTAGVAYVFFDGSAPPLADVVARAHARGIPVLVDAAGEVPPRANLKAISATGADLVAFSGGKAIGGPQSTGILCGRRHLVASAALQMLDMDDHYALWDPPPELIDKRRLAGMPRHGIGRGLKVSKENIVGLLTALDLFAAGPNPERTARWRADLQSIVEGLRPVRATCSIVEPADSECVPILEIAIDERALGRSAYDICGELRSGSPSVHVGHWKLDRGILVVSPLCLRPGDAAGIVGRLRAVLGTGDR